MTAPVLQDADGFDQRWLLRGDWQSPQEQVPRRFLSVFQSGQALALKPADGSGRRVLAESVLATASPLLACVWVNRVWQHLFGCGLVASVDDFGALGEQPSHPGLLDFLAANFIANGWSTKKLIREFMTTRAYSLAAEGEEDARQIDPKNKLFARFERRRLEGEVIRDVILQASGRLNHSLGGPPPAIHLTPFMTGKGRPTTSGPLDGGGRRSLYLGVRRNFLNPFLTSFDFPRPASTIGRRSRSNVPQQALTLLNDAFVHQQAKIWGRRLAKQKKVMVADRVSRVFMVLLARRPADDELRKALQFLGEKPQRKDWQAFCHVAFNLKEFIFVD